jgi:renalase
MRVVVIGAGLAGLVAARDLVASGADVVVVERSRSVGGRMATRRIGTATLDHGAQFFTVRTPAFRRRVDDWIERGLVRIWSHGFGSDDGYPRFIATQGMNSLTKDLANGLDVEFSTMAFAVRRPDEQRLDTESPWQVVIDDGSARPADAIVITIPLPQAFALLADAAVDLDESLFRTEYDRTITLLIVLDRPGVVPDPGAVQDPDGTFSFISDNAVKGVSNTPAMTFHASNEWSEANWEEDPEQLLDQLEQAATPWLGDARIVERQLKKWRFATPRKIWPDPYWATSDSRIVLAGDAFSGPRVEGAHNSGMAAAHSLIS